MSVGLDNIKDDLIIPNELDVLKDRARLMGIQFSNNIKIDTLRERISAKQEDKPISEDDDSYEDEENTDPDDSEISQEKGDEPEKESRLIEAPQAVLQANGFEAAAQVAKKKESISVAPNSPVESRKKSLHEVIREEEMRLIRCRITCMNPAKNDLEGEIITVANEYLGTVRKMVLFGEKTEEGYHIPKCILTALEEKKYLAIRSVKGKQGTPQVVKKWAKEFSIEILTPLTQEELKSLAVAQIAAGSVDNPEDNF